MAYYIQSMKGYDCHTYKYTNETHYLYIIIMFKVQTRSEFISNYQAGKRDFQHTILTAVNLSGSNLAQINLDGSNLIEVNCTDCNLERASLEQAYLGLSNFQSCCLNGVNLREANLEEANLSQANLANADLTRANLTRANLRGANLQGANLEDTCLKGAIYDSTTRFDANFVPQSTGTIESDPKPKLSPARSPESPGAIAKIRSWCHSARIPHRI